MHAIVNIFFFLSSDHSKGFGGKYGVLKDHQDEVKKTLLYSLLYENEKVDSFNFFYRNINCRN